MHITKSGLYLYATVPMAETTFAPQVLKVLEACYTLPIVCDLSRSARMLHSKSHLSNPKNRTTYKKK